MHGIVMERRAVFADRSKYKASSRLKARQGRDICVEQLPVGDDAADLVGSRGIANAAPRSNQQHPATFGQLLKQWSS